jgi:hypothetical protein
VEKSPLRLAQPRLSLSIMAGTSTQDRLTSDVVDGVLILGTTPGAEIGIGEIRYLLTVTRIQSVSIEASGGVRADFVGADTIELDIPGSGSVAYSGDAVVTQTIRGSGSVRDLN